MNLSNNKVAYRVINSEKGIEWGWWVGGEIDGTIKSSPDISELLIIITNMTEIDSRKKKSLYQ